MIGRRIMKFKIFMLFSLSVILLNACSDANQSATSAPNLLPMMSPTLSITPLPTQTIYPTPTSVPSTATLFPPFTPLPKLSKDDSLARTLDLLNANSSCALPCWWNIVPGKTNMRVAMNELLSFVSKATMGSGNGVVVGEFLYLVPKSISSIGFIDVTLTSRSDTVDQIDVANLNSWKYQLPSLLQTYGMPTSVWLRTYKSDYRMPQNTVPFLVALFYQEKGILAMFGETNGQVLGATIRGCIVGTAGLTLWSPAQNLNFDDVSTWKDYYDPYMTLEDASEIDVETFYERYKSGDTLPCIDTPAELWPDQ